MWFSLYGIVYLKNEGYITYLFFGYYLTDKMEDEKMMAKVDNW